MKWLKVLNKNFTCEIILNRPEIRNAFNPEMIEEITQVFTHLPETTRVVVLRGAGDVFCSGADLEWMKSMVHFSFDENKQDSLKLYNMFKAIKNCPVPVLTVVQGAAMGGALSLMAAADVVIAVESTKFCFSEVKLGLAPAVISSFVLAKVSRGVIEPWMITGKVFDVLEAQRQGLVHQVVKLEDLTKAVDAWVTAILEAAPEAVKATKKLVQQVQEWNEEQQKEMTATLIATRRVSKEGQEGLKAFLEKRAPSWKELQKESST